MWTQLLEVMHNSALGGHSGIQGTYKRLSQVFYWPAMMSDIKDYVWQCGVCQQNKTENVLSPDLLQPLAIPTKAWSDLAMDFVEGLPKSMGKNCIMGSLTGSLSIAI